MMACGRRALRASLPVWAVVGGVMGNTEFVWAQEAAPGSVLHIVSAEPNGQVRRAQRYIYRTRDMAAPSGWIEIPQHDEAEGGAKCTIKQPVLNDQFETDQLNVCNFPFCDGPGDLIYGTCDTAGAVCGGTRRFGINAAGQPACGSENMLTHQRFIAASAADDADASGGFPISKFTTGVMDNSVAGEQNFFFFWFFDAGAGSEENCEDPNAPGNPPDAAFVSVIGLDFGPSPGMVCPGGYTVFIGDADDPATPDIETFAGGGDFIPADGTYTMWFGLYQTAPNIMGDVVPNNLFTGAFSSSMNPCIHFQEDPVLQGTIHTDNPAAEGNVIILSLGLQAAQMTGFDPLLCGDFGNVPSPTVLCIPYLGVGVGIFSPEGAIVDPCNLDAPGGPDDCNSNGTLDSCEVANFTTVAAESFEPPTFMTNSGPGTGGWGWSSNIASVTTISPCLETQNLSTGSCDFGNCDAGCSDTASQTILSPNFINITNPASNNVVQRLTAKLRIEGANTGQCTAPTYFITPFHNDFPGGGQAVTRIGLRPNGSIVIDSEGDGVPPYAPASVAGATYPSDVCFDLSIITDRSQPAGSRLKIFIDGELVHSGDVTVIGTDPVTFLQSVNIESNNHAATRMLRLDGINVGTSTAAPADVANYNGCIDACPCDSGATSVLISAANPLTDNPYTAGQQPFRDVLQTGTTAALTQGIGFVGTPAQDSITYAPILVTFSGTPVPAPTTANVGIACTGGACPSVMAVSGSGPGPWVVALTAPIPPAHCTTLTFPGTAAGQKLQYQYLPGDVNLNGSTSPTDVQFLVANVINGNAALPANLARFNVNRAGGVTNLDILRLVGLLNGLQTTQVWTGVSVAACP